MDERRNKNTGNLRLGEKTAAEISKLYVASSNNDDWIPKQNPFPNYFQHQRKPKSTYLERPKKEDNNATTHAPSAFGPSHINKNSYEHTRVPKMIGENSLNVSANKHGKLEDGRLVNSYVSDQAKSLQQLENKDNNSGIISNNSAANNNDQVAEESIVIPQLPNTSSENVHKKENNSDNPTFNNGTETKFKLKKYNVDDDGHTWRPMKVNSSGDMKATSSVLLHQDGKRVNVDTSDSWVPNSGPVLKSRD